MNTSKKKYAKSRCIHYQTGKTERLPSAIRCRLTTYTVCDPKTCPWYKTPEDLAESYEKARQNFIANHGYDGYVQKGYGHRRRLPPRLKQED